MEAFSRVPMIIEKHMPSLCGSLPFIDHGAQLRRYDATEVEEREGFKSNIRYKQHLGVLATTFMPKRGSISRKQQIGAKRESTRHFVRTYLQLPNKTKTHARSQHRGARRAKRQLPICETKIQEGLAFVL